MNTKVFWLLGVALLAGCESPAEQAKSAKYEKLYREAGETVEALEHSLTVTEDRLSKNLTLLKSIQEELKDERKQREVAEKERDERDIQIGELKEKVGQLETDLQEARKASKDAPKKDEAKKE